MRNSIFIEFFPFALLVAFGCYLWRENDMMAIICLAVLALIVLVRLGADMKNQNP